MSRLLCALLGLSALALVGCSRGPSARATLPTTDPPQVAATSASRMTGTPSCSNRGCHGDFAQPGGEPYRSAYTHWLHHDPHANAYRSLESDLGQQIGKKLGLTPTTDARCLACHLTPTAVPATGEVERQERGSGVGCESCHGAARDWLVAHQARGWKARPAAEKEKLGMAALGTQARRAAVCAGCHVGAPADPARGLPLRDMNHDMIAAGHPRLLFEYASYLANEPKHWTERPDGAFEQRAWLVGQFASARAAMTLLADRAQRAKTDPWPELAEHDCFACHHDLHGRSWRQSRGYAGKAGAVAANRWYTAMLPAAFVGAMGEAMDDRFPLHQYLARRLPPPGLVRDEARRLANVLAALAERAEQAPLQDKAPGRVATTLRALVTLPTRGGWDEYEQAALGLSFFLPRQRQPKVRELLDYLAWPPGQLGPRDGPGKDFRAEALRRFAAIGP